jgi:hypothetical protein
MKTLVTLPLLLAVALFSFGCSHVPSVWELKYGADKPQFSYILPERDKQKGASDPGDLLIWNPNTNAAYLHPAGKACIQAADVYRVSSANANAGFKAGALGSKLSDVDVTTSNQMVQAALALSNQDAKGTFLSVALFNLCMLHANGAIVSEQNVLEAYKRSVEEAGKMTSPTFNSAPASVSATPIKP